MTQPTAARKPLPPHIVMLVGVLFLLAHVPSGHRATAVVALRSRNVRR